MNVRQMREEINKLYGEQWRIKVKHMSDRQIIAVYNRLKLQRRVK